MRQGLRLEQKQQLRMTPRLRLAIWVLQVTINELKQEIDRALSENPLLICAEGSVEPADHRESDRVRKRLWRCNMNDRSISKVLTYSGVGLCIYLAGCSGLPILGGGAPSQTTSATARTEPDAHSKSKAQPLHLAAAANDLQTVQRLLAGGADVNAKDAAGDTPLLKAADGLHLDVIRLLVGARADVNTRNTRDETALLRVSLARSAGQAALRRSVVAVLMAGGAKAAPVHAGDWTRDESTALVYLTVADHYTGADADSVAAMEHFKQCAVYYEKAQDQYRRDAFNARAAVTQRQQETFRGSSGIIGLWTNMIMDRTYYEVPMTKLKADAAKYAEREQAAARGAQYCRSRAGGPAAKP